ncbi:MAG: 3-dehydroquinate synthase, partial [Coriobacteriia bacterium]|nr:3-dehydroquinate synthase [Coriobacteriia bacterium]
GHAIEKVAGYGVYSHGAAVAEGMRFAARLAQRVAGVPEEFVLRQTELLDALGLGPILGEIDTDGLRLAMSSDKKSRGGTPRFVLATAPGRFTVTPVSEAILTEELRAWACDRG